MHFVFDEILFEVKGKNAEKNPLPARHHLSSILTTFQHGAVLMIESGLESSHSTRLTAILSVSITALCWISQVKDTDVCSFFWIYRIILFLTKGRRIAVSWERIWEEWGERTRRKRRREGQDTTGIKSRVCQGQMNSMKWNAAKHRHLQVHTVTQTHTHTLTRSNTLPILALHWRQPAENC